MAPTTIFFNGRLISIPGSYSEINASGLESSAAGAAGVIACLGTAEGGKPYTAIDPADVEGTAQVALTDAQARRYFRSGDLLEASPMLFGPMNDPDVQNGAASVIFVKVNPSAASTASFANGDGAALVLTSRDYGYFTTQIRAAIATGTSKGKLVTLTHEATVEAFDDVGGDTMLTLQYLATTPADGFTTVNASIAASGVTAAFTRAAAGLDSHITNPVTAGQVVEVVSSDAGDTAIVVEIVGTTVTNTTQRARVMVNGTTPVDTAVTWNAVHGARIVSGTAAGTITLRNDGAGTTITTLTAGAPTKGLSAASDMSATGALAYVADAATTARVTIVGLSTAGVLQTETIVLNGTTPVAGVATWSRIDYLAVGGLAAARTLTISGTAVSAPVAGIGTLAKLADKFNATPGWTLTLATGQTAASPAILDHASATNVKSPATLTATATLDAIIERLNTSSSLVTASRGTPGTGAPSNTAADVFLAGGHEGSATPGLEGVPTATYGDWQAAIDLLTKVFKNSLVLLTSDPAVHAAGAAHCAYMAGPGRQECDLVVGLENAGRTAPPTKTEIKTQIRALNSRHVAAWAQSIERYDTAGERRIFAPYFGAALLAGGQAGAPVGTPLTAKTLNALAISQDASWNATDDAEELIQAGLCFARATTTGRRIVRAVTTHLTTNNLAFVEKSVNHAVNYAVYNFRTAMERSVGRAGFVGSVAAADTEARAQLGLMVGVALVAWRSLSISLTLDVLETAVEVAPVLPINFVKSTVHLVTVPQRAAAA